MHHTAAQLEVAEAILHRSAAQTPNPDTADRLDSLGEQVTAQAHDIDRRADRLAGPPGPDPAPHQRSLPGHKTTAPGNSDDSEVA
ncbi:hypothetical protein CLV67_12718 [Actinoplanes italicus]|uniref:Uncharacterized protein n=2 Tax=Actinoplanes italicus TaxID=113567 RepID=A0A2T0JX62_9ACTN|nr:hypothetical protein CLV67_12718 [Actinoplanes italicus]